MLQQVVAYNIIESDKHDAMTDGVNGAIKDGWVPSGPLVLQGDRLMQVMVKFGD